MLGLPDLLSLHSDLLDAKGGDWEEVFRPILWKYHLEAYERDDLAAEFYAINNALGDALLESRRLPTKGGRYANSELKFLSFWQRVQCILPQKVRANTFEPLYDEYKEDYLIACPNCITARARFWLKFCFATKAIWVAAACLVNEFMSKIAELLVRLWKPKL